MSFSVSEDRAANIHAPSLDRYFIETLVAPGERVDVIVEASEPGTWAFHCHILNHAEGTVGMFGMVSALIVR